MTTDWPSNRSTDGQKRSRDARSPGVPESPSVIVQGTAEHHLALIHPKENHNGAHRLKEPTALRPEACRCQQINDPIVTEEDSAFSSGHDNWGEPTEVAWHKR